MGLGVVVGAAIGFVLSEVIARVDDPLIETALTTIAAYGSFILAEQFTSRAFLRQSRLRW